MSHAGARLIHDLMLQMATPARFDRVLHHWMAQALAKGGLALTTKTFVDALNLDAETRARVMKRLAGQP